MKDVVFVVCLTYLYVVCMLFARFTINYTNQSFKSESTTNYQIQLL